MRPLMSQTGALFPLNFFVGITVQRVTLSSYYQEYSMLVEEYRKTPNSLWIMKPVGRSQGKGIFLFEKLSQISEWKSDTRWKKTTSVTSRRERPPEEPPQAEAYVCQRYIEDPLLIGGMHLTNVAIQRSSREYDESSGGKWPLHKVKQFLVARYGEPRVNELMLQIDQLILKPLIAVSKVMIHDKHCCELYGYDIIIDSKLKISLLCTASNAADYEFKLGLIDDVLTIIDMEKYLTGSETQIGEFTLLYQGEPVNEIPPECTTRSYLGEQDISRSQSESKIT